MPKPMSQFLSALRGLEETKTPLSVETPTSTGDTAVLGSSRQQAHDPNEVETEEMGVRQESLRRSKVHRLTEKSKPSH
jgi:hypothetical protein